jgi:hypothetical protein
MQASCHYNFTSHADRRRRVAACTKAPRVDFFSVKNSKFASRPIPTTLTDLLKSEEGTSYVC